MTYILMTIVINMNQCLYDFPAYALMFICLYVLITFLLMNESLYVFYVK
jgi:hypothetical protein